MEGRWDQGRIKWSFRAIPGLLHVWTLGDHGAGSKERDVEVFDLQVMVEVGVRRGSRMELQGTTMLTRE